MLFIKLAATHSLDLFSLDGLHFSHCWPFDLYADLGLYASFLSYRSFILFDDGQ